MEQLFSGEIYQKPDDAPAVSDFTQKENSNLILAAMKDVAYNDDETWSKYLNQMTIEEMTGQLSDISIHVTCQRFLTVVTVMQTPSVTWQGKVCPMSL